jgi:hypothetical protein
MYYSVFAHIWYDNLPTNINIPASELSDFGKIFYFASRLIDTDY